MTYLKRITVLLVVLGLATTFAQAANQETAKKPTEKPDATLTLSGGAFALGVGFSWGKGTLTYKGKDYPVSVDGLTLGKVGLSGASATGEVYGLKSLKNFDGHYAAASAGMTVAAGRTAVALKNQNNVRVFFISTTRGLDVTVGGAGVKMKIKK